ncbi:hypothetical protein LMG19083_01378 [Ralstonia psammae]|uniref:Secreted protein n=1 Tax=Ralstonia psammae TaxID=3058598 RepID=A0ABM9J8A1_9RALS|nr:hypothetical protein [Ralstonia sp. LMG 19083]CAJ0786055.1 hypothetical protein LMG19083_01378 [Ralstonia sp. LMG 19083]
MASKHYAPAWAWTALLAAVVGLVGTTGAAGPTGAATNTNTNPSPHMQNGKVVPPPRPSVPTVIVPGMPRSLMREAEHGHSTGGTIVSPSSVHRQNGNVWVD